MIKKSLYVDYVKRMLDILLSMAVIILGSPVFIIVSILILIKLGRPIIFKQDRIGLNGEIFKLYKFRTMLVEKNELEIDDSERTTKFGEILRSSSLDELPQFFNILFGDMSFIGPRPCVLYDLIFMDDNVKKRHLIKPGLSGLAQISGRNGISWDQKINKDLEYIKTVSFLMDIKIFLKTFLVVIKKNNVKFDNEVTQKNYGEYLLKVNRISKEDFDNTLRDNGWKS